MAEILGFGEATAGRICKNVGISTFQRVKATRAAEPRRARRGRLAGEILLFYVGGVRTKRIF